METTFDAAPPFPPGETLPSFRVMHARYEPTTLADQTVDVLTAEDAGVRLTVARRGAEPVSLARRDARGRWQGFLHRDGDLSKPASGWGNHATVMGYYVHRLLNEQSLLRGRPVRGGTHSFLRQKTFAEPEVELTDAGATLVYTMPPDGFATEEYPLRVGLSLSYTLRPDGAWRVGFRFTNHEEHEAAPVSFGLHPGFAVGSLEGCEVLLAPGRYRRLLAPGNFLNGETVEFDHPGGPMPFARSDLPGSFLLDLAGVPKRAFTLRDPVGGRQVTLDCPEAPFLTIWSDGGPFVCLEPCWGMPDHHAQRPFEEKLGIETVPPAGGTLERGFTVRTELI